MRRMEYEERIEPTVSANRRELKAIDKAVAALNDPLEREVIKIRYIDADGYKPLKCREVAISMYGKDDDADLLRVHRIHREAIRSLQEILQKEDDA